jgi:hypothetical protein
MSKNVLVTLSLTQICTSVRRAIVGHASVEVPSASSGGYGNNWH